MTIKRLNKFVNHVSIILFICGTVKMTGQSIKETFETHTSDCVIQFDIAPMAPWQDINILPATGGNDKNTRILLAGGVK